MSAPNQWTLNERDLDWLTAEEKSWTMKIAQHTKTATYTLVEAQQYLAAVRAELAQRTEQMSTLQGRLTWRASGALEMLGGSGGAGAQGLAASASDTASEVAAGAADVARNALIALGLVGLLVAAYLFKKK